MGSISIYSSTGFFYQSNAYSIITYDLIKSRSWRWLSTFTKTNTYRANGCKFRWRWKVFLLKIIFLFYILYIYSDEEGERTHRGSSHKSIVKSVWKLFIVDFIFNWTILFFRVHLEQHHYPMLKNVFLDK